MDDRRRDIAVGLTVLVALLMFSAMVVIFTGVPSALQTGYSLEIAFPSTNGAKSGDPVRLAGVRVGSITDVGFTDGDPRKGVTFTAIIGSDQRIPANVNAYIRSSGFGGNAYIELRPDGPQRSDPQTGEPMSFFPTDRTTHIQGSRQAAGGMIPQEVLDAVAEMRTGFREIGQLAANLNEFLAGPEPRTDTVPATTQPGAAAVFRETVAKLGRTLDDLHAVLGDETSQEKLKEAVANLADASAKAAEAMEELTGFAEDARTAMRDATETSATARRGIEEITEKLLDSAEKTSQLLASINRTMARVESGEGTLGKVLTDARLYTHLADAARQLERLIVEMRELVRSWRGGGVRALVK